MRNILILGLMFFSCVFSIGTVSAQDAEDYVGAEACKLCHSGTYDSWSETAHSNEKGCVGCHTTGEHPDGTHVLNGVQCEACHSTGADHAASGSADDIVVDKSSDSCGECHTTIHTPQFDEWEKSGHADAVTCRACHDPHGSPNEAQLKSPAAEVCMQCHKAQAEMLVDSIMYNADVTCSDCHMYVKPYESMASPRITGHTFEPRPEQCVIEDCHPIKDVTWAKNAISLYHHNIEDLLEEAEHELSLLDSTLLKINPAWDGSKRSIGDASETVTAAVDYYIQAEHNIESVKKDKSLGVHNRIKAEHMLKEAKTLTEEGLGLLGVKIEHAQKGVCGPTAVLLLAMLPAAAIGLRKKR